MAVMNVVWPVCALFGTLGVTWAYLRYGRLASMESVQRAKARGPEDMPRQGTDPIPRDGRHGSASLRQRLHVG